ncbi:hypothetical protein ACFTXJ_22215 [Streptomyces zhihengii]|uniref:hypothetical protein n=1 Tax=Streptomyces zhihengii TaxID=1818004 RepID=UPI003642D7B6
MELDLVGRAPEGLSRRARSLLGGHCVRVDVTPVESNRAWWLERGIPPEQIDRMAAFQDRWGGLLLPPSQQYEGGPKYFDPDVPEEDADGWWFEAGMQRASVDFSFMIGPDDSFGIHARRWTPLHASVDGWVESVALAYHARMWSRSVTRVAGDDVDALPLADCDAVPEVRGLADTWWRGEDLLVALHTGEALCRDAPGARTAYVYSGLDTWGLDV